MGVSPDGGRWKRRAEWVVPASVLAVGFAALAVAGVRSEADRSAFDFGLLYTLWRYERALPLVGLGLALAQVRPRLVAVNCVVFALGLPLGAVVSGWIAAALAAGAGFYDQLLLIDPVVCALAGLTLVSGGMARVWLLPPVTLVIAVVLGLVINLNDPMPAEQAFAAGSLLIGAWLVAVPSLVWRNIERSWFRIAARIFGGWLIAIGTMLGALYIVSPPDSTVGQQGLDGDALQPGGSVD